MKYFYCLILLIIFSTSSSFAQRVETDLLLDLPMTNFSTDVNSYSDIGASIDLGLRVFIVDRLQFEFRPGLFISEGDFHISGSQLAFLARYEIWKNIGGYSGINLKSSNLSVSGRRSISTKNGDFSELIFGGRLGSEIFGVNLSYYYPLTKDIGTIKDDEIIHNLCIDGTVQVGFEIKLFTIKNLFPNK